MTDIVFSAGEDYPIDYEARQPRTFAPMPLNGGTVELEVTGGRSVLNFTITAAGDATGKGRIVIDSDRTAGMAERDQGTWKLWSVQADGKRNVQGSGKIRVEP